MLKLTRVFILGLSLFALLLTAGCDQADTADVGKDSGKNVETADPSSDKSAGGLESQGNSARMKVYFSNEDGTKLIAKSKPAPKQNQYAASIDALIDGSDDSHVLSMIPHGTKLRSIRVEKGIAYVDFSQELVKKFSGGSTGEMMLVASIVNTLTEFPEIHAVQILIEGRMIETISGHMDLSEPLKRFEEMLKN